MLQHSATSTERTAVSDAPVRTSAVLAVILVSYLMIVLDISVVITALPKMQRSLGFSTASLSWVQNAYTLVFGGLLLLGARAGDILGGSLGLAVLVTVFAAAGPGTGTVRTLFTHQVSAALMVGSGLLALALVAILLTRPRVAAQP